MGSRKHGKLVPAGHISWVFEFLNNSLSISSEDIPQSGTTKALDICVQQKLPESEIHFSLWLLRDQKQKSEEVFLGACEHKSGSGGEQESWKQRSYLSCRTLPRPGSVQRWNRNFIGKFFYSGDFSSPHHIPSVLISIIEVNISSESFYHYYFEIRLLPLIVCYRTLVFKGF